MRKYRFTVKADIQMLRSAEKYSRTLWQVKLMTPKMRIYTFYMEEVRTNVFVATAELELSTVALGDIRQMFDIRNLKVIEETI